MAACRPAACAGSDLVPSALFRTMLCSWTGRHICAHSAQVGQDVLHTFDTLYLTGFLPLSVVIISDFLLHLDRFDSFSGNHYADAGQKQVASHVADKQGCPKVCECPVSSKCPSQAPRIQDKCGCGCIVCAQSLDSPCDGLRPCNPKQNLTCNYWLGSEDNQGVCKVYRKHRSCFNNGTEVLHGERFQEGCVGACKCENGVSYCVSLCPPYQPAFDPHCKEMRYVSIPGECCKRWQCKKYDYSELRISIKDASGKNGSCLHNGTEIFHGQKFQDGCAGDCECRNGTAICILQCPHDKPAPIPGCKELELVRDNSGKNVSCSHNGNEILHNQEFQDGCTGSCVCDNGGIKCVSLCPPYQPAPIPGCKEMELASVTGECCKQWRCKEYDHSPVTLFPPTDISGKNGSCFHNGREILHGQNFQDGCTGRCLCENGGIKCVSLCPPYQPAPIPGCKEMEQVSVPGECCKQWRCKEYDESQGKDTTATVVSSKKASCFHNGREILHGQNFQDGCTGRCLCENGGIKCVSLCPPYQPAPIPGCKEMEQVSVPGECCKQWRCKEYDESQGKDTTATVVSSKKASCFHNGREILHGQNFQDGCTGRCLCENGGIKCVSLCPPYQPAPIPGCKEMEEVSVSGECCKQWRCKEYDESQGKDTTATVVSSKKASCFHNGREILHGQNFQDGCTGRCLCDNGGIKCVSLCPPYQPAPIPGCKEMEQVSVPGECCKQWKCKEYYQPADSEIPQRGRPIRSRRDATDRVEEAPLNSSTPCSMTPSVWTHCSRPCGFGHSVRITYNPGSCTPQAERRLCMVRPCKGEYSNANYTILKSTSVCNRLVRWTEQLHLHHRGCQSLRPLSPKFCGQCTDGRVCTPSLSETRSVAFQCPHNNRRVTRQIMWVQKCNCSNRGGKKERKRGGI
ncbi:kielin/chordin-like protein [Pelodytes ibericus]